MKRILSNAAAVRAAAAAGNFCDTGHYYCAVVSHDGTVRWPSGATLSTDGTFRGPRALLERLESVPSDYFPEPVAPADRYPHNPAGDITGRCCCAVE